MTMIMHILRPASMTEYQRESFLRGWAEAQGYDCTEEEMTARKAACPVYFWESEIKISLPESYGSDLDAYDLGIAYYDAMHRGYEIVAIADDTVIVRQQQGSYQMIVEYDDYYDADRDDVLPGAAYVALYVATDSDTARAELIAAARAASANVFPDLAIREM